MSDVLSRELPAPKLWQEFESLAFDLYRRLWKTNDAQMHGRRGQPQSGVDVYGTDRVEQTFTGVQCKGKDGDYGGALTEAELRQEVEKARTFQPPLDVYVVVTTAPNDASIQKIAREISQEHKKIGIFEVRVTGWDTLRHYISEDQELLLKYFRDFAPVDLLGQLEVQAQENARGFARLERMFQGGNRLISEGRDDHDAADELASRVFEIGKLVADGSPKAALKALDRTEAEAGDSASPLAKYRILANKGNAHFVLGDEKTAIEFFLRAYEAYPEYPNARSTLALVHLLEGRRKEACELAKVALQDDPTSVRNAGILVDSLPDGMSIDEIKAFIPPGLVGDFELQLHLALRAAAIGELSAQRQFAEEALRLNPDDWRPQSAVAEALTQPLSSMDEILITRALPPEHQGDIDRAVELMRKAWAQLASRDSSFQGRHVAANLMGLLSLLGNEEEAERVLSEALPANRNYEPLALASAQRFASRGDWEGVIAALDGLPRNDLSFNAVLLRTQGAFALRDPTSAREWFDMLGERHAHEPELAERAEMIEALRVKLAVLDGGDMSDAIDHAIGANPKSIVLRSFLFDELGEGDPLRDRLVGEIRELAKGELSLRERLHAAETLFIAGNFSLAADLYATLHANASSFALRRNLIALHEADRRGEARKLFESLPPELRESPSYLGIGINIYERAGLLKPALRLVEQALSRADSLHARLSWIQLLLRLGRQSQVSPWLAAVPEDVEGSAEDLMALAQLVEKYLVDDSKALGVGYRALRLGYGQPSIHLRYAFGLVVGGNVGEGPMAAPERVEAGTGVELVNEATGETLFRIIETGPNPVIERGEIAADDPFAERILGLSVGDSIDIVKAGAGTQKHRISEIQSRYLFAFRRTLRDFPALFPDNPAFGSFSIDESKGDKKFDDLFMLARERADQGKQIEAIYRDGVVPLPLIAKFAGTNVFDMWHGLSAQPDLGLKSSIGVDAEFAGGRAAAAGGVSIVDPVTVYAWVQLGFDDIIGPWRGSLAVVQATIDMLRDLVLEREAKRGKKSGVVGWDGQHYRFVELTDDEIEEQVASATAALAMAESLPVVAAEADAPLREQVAEILSNLNRAYHDTIIAALQPKRAILTDDLGFRAVAQEAGASCTWTQSFAQHALFEGAISHPQYRRVVGALVDANYRFTQFRYLEVLAELQDSAWLINNRVRSYARLLLSDKLDRASVARLLAQLIIESRRHTSDEIALAAFHVEYLELSKGEGKEARARSDYAAARVAAVDALHLMANRNALRPRLLRTTYITPVASLTVDLREIAERAADQCWQMLRGGGLQI
jgi:tetratricopeptide (TPR) repeat protein